MEEEALEQKQSGSYLGGTTVINHDPEDDFESGSDGESDGRSSTPHSRSQSVSSGTTVVNFDLDEDDSPGQPRRQHAGSASSDGSIGNGSDTPTRSGAVALGTTVFKEDDEDVLDDLIAEIIDEENKKRDGSDAKAGAANGTMAVNFDPGTLVVFCQSSSLTLLIQMSQMT